MTKPGTRRYEWSGLGLVAFALLALTGAVIYLESGIVPLRHGAELTATDDPLMYWTTLVALFAIAGWLGWTGVRIVLGLQQPYDWSAQRKKRPP